MKKVYYFLFPAIIPFTSQAGNGPEAKSLHEFPALGYAYNALEPVIDAMTMEIHYTRHHRGYYDNFMKAAAEAGLLQTPLTEILENIGRYPVVLRNNGGGYYNHNLFWENLSPVKKTVPAQLAAAIAGDLGSMENFRTAFENAAKTRFGSGWAWLSVGSDGKLFVSSTPNQDNPLMDVAEQKGTPILGLDVWEHAYYLKYQNKRADYVAGFWELIDWEVVAERYRKAILK